MTARSLHLQSCSELQAATPPPVSVGMTDSGQLPELFGSTGKSPQSSFPSPREKGRLLGQRERPETPEPTLGFTGYHSQSYCAGAAHMVHIFMRPRTSLWPCKLHSPPEQAQAAPPASKQSGPCPFHSPSAFTFLVISPCPWRASFPSLSSWKSPYTPCPHGHRPLHPAQFSSFLETLL